MFFLVLFVCAAEDLKHHKVSNRWTAVLCLPGLIRIGMEPEDRWETAVLTCLFFFLLYVLYRLTRFLGKKSSRRISFGGADVRLIPGMMLFLGWKEALCGIFTGLCAAAVWYVVALLSGKGRREREVPLVPWIASGTAVVTLARLYMKI